MHVPEELSYSSDHEWARNEGSNKYRIGITDYAQDALGDVVYVDLPEVGATVTMGTTVGEVESTKSVSDIFTPVTGTVVEVNTDLVDAPEQLNSDPYGEGWMFVIEVSEEPSADALLTAAAYTELTEA